MRTVSQSLADSTNEESRAPLVTAKSQAAGGPDRHLGMYTSAGRLALAALSSSSYQVPFSYSRIHAEAVAARGLAFLALGAGWLMLLIVCHVSQEVVSACAITPTTALQQSEWSPKVSIMPSHHVPSTSWSENGILSQRRSMVTYRHGSLSREAVLQGLACNHKPAPSAEIKLRCARRARGTASRDVSTSF